MSENETKIEDVPVRWHDGSIVGTATVDTDTHFTTVTLHDDVPQAVREALHPTPSIGFRRVKGS